jgi:hypothetical protein
MNSFIKDFRDLDAWKKANELSLKIYLLSRGLPDDEKFGLIS